MMPATLLRGTVYLDTLELRSRLTCAAMGVSIGLLSSRLGLLAIASAALLASFFVTQLVATRRD